MAARLSVTQNWKRLEHLRFSLETSLLYGQLPYWKKLTSEYKHWAAQEQQMTLLTFGILSLSFQMITCTTGIHIQYTCSHNTEECTCPLHVIPRRQDTQRTQLPTGRTLAWQLLKLRVSCPHCRHMRGEKRVLLMRRPYLLRHFYVREEMLFLK